MITSIHSICPTAQPYSPYYTGTESVVTIPAGVVDWILVELRDKTDATTIIATRAAFVKNDGSIVDGCSAVQFENLPADNYYVAVKHRNHLGVMTQDALRLE